MTPDNFIGILVTQCGDLNRVLVIVDAGTGGAIRAVGFNVSTDGATMPAWSGTGAYGAYLSGGSIWVLPRNALQRAREGASAPNAKDAGEGGAPRISGKPAKVHRFSERLDQAQLAWAGDSALFFRSKTCLGRVEVPNTALLKIAEWESPRAPELKPEDFTLLELPRVTVRYARFDRKYAEAFGNILAEALNVYESLGF